MFSTKGLISQKKERIAQRTNQKKINILFVTTCKCFLSTLPAFRGRKRASGPRYAHCSPPSYRAYLPVAVRATAEMKALCDASQGRKLAHQGMPEMNTKSVNL